MKNVRITPISLVLAGLLTWVLWELLKGPFRIGLLYVSILFVILVAVDQAARVLIRDMRRVWLIEVVFLSAVILVAWIVKIWFFD